MKQQILFLGDFMKKLYSLYKTYIYPVEFNKCAALSYYSILALIPGLSILFLFVRFFNVSSYEIQTFLSSILPLESVKPIVNFVIHQSQTSIFTTIIISISSLYIISQGVYIFIKYINSMFSFEEQSYLQLRVRAFFVSLFLIFALALLLISLMLILPKIATNLSVFVYYLLLFILYVAIHFIVIFLLYKFCMLKNVKLKYLWKGLFFFSTTASILYFLFSPFIQTFANNYASYGPLAGFASILIFFYVYFVLLLISINISLFEYQKMIK